MALLERARELDAVDALIERAVDGDGAGLLVEGHAGIGKTSLIAEAGERARAAGLRVLSACGGDLAQPFAFAAVRQL